MNSSVVAFAGRRVDPICSKRPAFPLEAVSLVSARIEAYLRRVAPAAVFSAAACGADLLILRAAGRLGIPRTVVLPFDRDLFRKTSVLDRRGYWEDYDNILDRVGTEGGLEILQFRKSGPTAFQAVNTAILDRAQASRFPVRACIVWEGADKGQADYTAGFRSSAERRGIVVDEISTTRSRSQYNR